MSKNLTAADFIGALHATGGLIAPAARRLKVTRQTVYRATKTYPTVQQALNDARDDLLDLCEGNIFKSASEGNLSTSKWLLERLGRDRGYVFRVETKEYKGKTSAELAAMSDDELNDYTAELGVKD